MHLNIILPNCNLQLKKITFHYAVSSKNGASPILQSRILWHNWATEQNTVAQMSYKC